MCRGSSWRNFIGMPSRVQEKFWWTNRTALTVNSHVHSAMPALSPTFKYCGSLLLYRSDRVISQYRAGFPRINTAEVANWWGRMLPEKLSWHLKQLPVFRVLVRVNRKLVDTSSWLKPRRPTTLTGEEIDLRESQKEVGSQQRSESITVARRVNKCKQWAAQKQLDFHSTTTRTSSDWLLVSVLIVKGELYSWRFYCLQIDQLRKKKCEWTDTTSINLRPWRTRT